MTFPLGPHPQIWGYLNYFPVVATIFKKLNKSEDLESSATKSQSENSGP